MGPYKGLRAVKQIVEGCMQNIHPIYGLKQLLIKRELSKDDRMKTETWDKWLPHFKKTHLKRAKRKKVRRDKKLDYTPFPPAPQKSKLDIALETGEYFMANKRKERDGDPQKAAKRSKKDKHKKREGPADGE